ncbi:hypothetical protein THAOC_18072, partial [Thalassiosira oceanica]
MGTSLTVAPANSLVYRVPMTSLRLVMNNEMVGRRLGIDYEDDSVRDVWASGYTDQSCLDLSERLGWLDDLATMADELPESSADLLRKKLAQRTQSSSCGNGNDTKKLSDNIEDQQFLEKSLRAVSNLAPRISPDSSLERGLVRAVAAPQVVRPRLALELLGADSDDVAGLVRRARRVSIDARASGHGHVLLARVA